MTVAAKLKRTAFKHVEAELYCCHDMLKEIQVIRNNIMFCWEKVDENIGGDRDSFLGKPPESIAARLAAHKRLIATRSNGYIHNCQKRSKGRFHYGIGQDGIHGMD